MVAFTDSNKQEYKTFRYSVLMSGQWSPIVFSSTLILHAAFPLQSLLTLPVLTTGEQYSAVLNPFEHIFESKRKYFAQIILITFEPQSILMTSFWQVYLLT